jgi:UDP:flavonoid glycosyltransferase YjiC (YdhE family)
MARILVAWQLGSHYGHLTADLPIAEALREAGHDVLFAVSDPRVAAEVLTPASFEFLPVPLPQSLPGAAEAPISYSDILVAAGFGDALTALGLTRGWMSLLKLARTDVLVADHAPMALLAARACGIPSVPIGSGFTVPPSMSPAPSIRAWESVSLEKLLAADQRALAGANAALESLGRAPLGALWELFGSGGALLTTFPELDHYGPREDCVYLGPVSAQLRSAPQSWQPGSAPRIFAYLRPTVPRVDAVLSALEACEAQVLCAMPDATAELIRHFAGTGITMSAAPLPAAALLERADLTVTYGGQGLIASSLLAGVPLLVVPQTVEQYGGARLVERLGAGICLAFDRDEPRAAAALRQLLTDRRYRDAARRFAAEHADFDGATAARRAAEVIASLAAGKTPN